MLSNANKIIRSPGQSDLRTTAAFVLGSKSPCSVCCSTNSNSNAAHMNTSQVRSYFTNGDRVKREDPYAVLGLQWGDGSTTTEIKAAYKKMAVRLHPDVNKDDKNAHQKFQDLQKAYQTIMKISTSGDGPFGTRAIGLPWIGPMWLVSLGNDPSNQLVSKWLLDCWGIPTVVVPSTDGPIAPSIWVMVLVLLIA
jgi:hypothetical protein